MHQVGRYQTVSWLPWKICPYGSYEGGETCDTLPNFRREIRGSPYMPANDVQYISAGKEGEIRIDTFLIKPCR